MTKPIFDNKDRAVDDKTFAYSPNAKFALLRAFRDGEMMCSHVVAEFSDYATLHQNLHLRGSIVRISDNAVLTSDGWIDSQTGAILPA